jgi:hypothetical protein
MDLVIVIFHHRLGLVEVDMAEYSLAVRELQEQVEREVVEIHLPMLNLTRVAVEEFFMVMVVLALSLLDIKLMEDPQVLNL